MPRTVTTGGSAPGSTCRASSRPSVTPLARPVRTKSSCRDLRSEAARKRARTAPVGSARQSAGSSRYCTPMTGSASSDPCPEAGSTLKVTARTRTSSTPVTYGGTASARFTAPPSRRARRAVPRTMPAAPPPASANSRAAAVSSSVLPRLCQIRSVIGAPRMNEVPRSPVRTPVSQVQYWTGSAASRPSEARTSATVAAEASGPARTTAGSPARAAGHRRRARTPPAARAGRTARAAVRSGAWRGQPIEVWSRSR